MIEYLALFRARLRGSDNWPGDWRAGWVSAVVMLPQAVVLATLAGMPPEAGVYTSIFPVIVAALVGASPRLLSGPNTAIAVMLAAALTPLATPASTEYVVLALTLTAMVGIVQLLAAGAKLGRLFDAMPDIIVHGVTLGVGVVIIATQLPISFGVLSVPGEAAWVSLWHAAVGVTRLNPFALAVTVFSIVCGALAMRQRACRGVFLIVALAAGSFLAILGDALFGSDTTNLDRVGHLALNLFPVSIPQFSWDQFYVLKQLASSAIAIAAIGALQTLIIARSTASGEGEAVNPNRELLAQGIGNVVASFASGFAGSGSFNRSAAHVSAGARTHWAAVLSALILFGLLFAAGGFIAQVPAAAMAGALILIGWRLIRTTPLTEVRLAGARPLATTVVIALLVVVAGLETAVFWGCAGGVAVLISRHALDRRSRLTEQRVELPPEKLKAARRAPTLLRDEPPVSVETGSSPPQMRTAQRTGTFKPPRRQTTEKP